MTVQSVIQVCLVVILVRQIEVHWSLCVRGWERLGKRKQRKGSKRDKKPVVLGAKDAGPKPFEGLTQQPECELCVAEAEEQEEETKREPPPRVERAKGRRPEVDTSNHFCPQERCRYHGWLDRGNIIANGHPSGGQRRQLKCAVCGKHFQETTGMDERRCDACARRAAGRQLSCSRRSASRRNGRWPSRRVQTIT